MTGLKSHDHQTEECGPVVESFHSGLVCVAMSSWGYGMSVYMVSCQWMYSMAHMRSALDERPVARASCDSYCTPFVGLDIAASRVWAYLPNLSEEAFSAKRIIWTCIV